MNARLVRAGVGDSNSGRRAFFSLADANEKQKPRETTENMTKLKFSRDQKQKPAGALPSAGAQALSRSEMDFAPSAAEVARKAYFCYVNEGSRPGHDVQHWLAAEAELIAERNLTRVHGFPGRTTK